MPLVLSLLGFLATGLVVVVACDVLLGWWLDRWPRRRPEPPEPEPPEAERPISEVCTTKYGDHVLYLN